MSSVGINQALLFDGNYEEVSIEFNIDVVVGSLEVSALMAPMVGSFALSVATEECSVVGIGTINTQIVDIGTLDPNDIEGIGTLDPDEIVGLGPLCK